MVTLIIATAAEVLSAPRFYISRSGSLSPISATARLPLPTIIQFRDDRLLFLRPAAAVDEFKRGVGAICEGALLMGFFSISAIIGSILYYSFLAFSARRSAETFG